MHEAEPPPLVQKLHYLQNLINYRNYITSCAISKTRLEKFVSKISKDSLLIGPKI